jgi:gamma-glutamylcyclotransferase (GGCT)/AIG2-like uncharacterized protein YtfP
VTRGAFARLCEALARGAGPDHARAVAAASRVLAAYGSLRPGQSNHRIVAGIVGTWSYGAVSGHVREVRWGPDEVYPGLVLDPAGPRVPVAVLTSAELPEHWARLDAFEGPDYRRVVVPVELDAGGAIAAQCYVLADPART